VGEDNALTPLEFILQFVDLGHLFGSRLCTLHGFHLLHRPPQNDEGAGPAGPAPYPPAIPCGEHTVLPAARRVSLSPRRAHGRGLTLPIGKRPAVYGFTRFSSSSGRPVARRSCRRKTPA